MKWTALVFLLFLAAGAVIYPFWASAAVASWFGQLAQFTALILGGYNATLSFDQYGQKDEPRKAWFAIAVGLWIWVIAQFMASYSDLVLHRIPYASWADVFWSIGYVFLISGVWQIVRNFWNSGLPVGSRASYFIQAVFLLIFFAVIFYIYIWTQLIEPGRPLANKFLDIFYPAMDFILVCLISVLIRVAWMMRGGILAKSWIFLCIGFFLVGVADLWLSYSEDIESVFYRLNDLAYFCSYFFIALAGMYQVRMMKTL